MKTTLETLGKGQTLLTTIRKVANDSYQAEFAEIIENSENKNALAALNKGDERFTQQGKPRRAWAKITAESAMEFFNIDLIKDKVDEEGKEYNILNPTDSDGTRFRVEIRDSKIPNDYQAANVQKTAKQTVNRSTGEVLYFRHNGSYIFSNTTIILGEPKHSLISTKEGNKETSGLFPFGYVFPQTANVQETAPFEAVAA